MQDQLLELLAAREGHFRLESGHHGDLWLDLDRLFLRPRRVRPLAAELARRLAQYEVSVVCGPLVGGALLAQWIAHDLDVAFCWTERVAAAQSGGLYPVVYRLPRGVVGQVRSQRVAVVDDAINAGSAVRGTLAALRDAGAQPVAVGALLVLGAAAPGFLGDQGLPVESLLHRQSNLWAPPECPLCAGGTPLEDLIPDA